ncbi:sulfatase [Daejeonella sp.]|uniref:sulfatase n=1 Tax=Daejeonella sp. TaxID=2805397 RepID=UPI0030C5B5A7
MKRYIPFFSSILVLLTIFSSQAQIRDAQIPTQGQKPNVIFIVVDDMNSWSVINDYPVLKVPNIKKLVSQSYYFSNASCAAPVCIPSRASFFSGLYPHNTGVYTNGPDVWSSSKKLIEVEAMPELFKKNGYTTWGRGKTFHVALPGTREQDMFDNKVYNGGFGPFAARELWPGNSNWYGIQPWEGPDTDFPDVKNANAAMEFISQKHEKPFFMFYGMYRPHTPYTAPKRFMDMYKDSKITLPSGFMENDLDDVPEMGKELVDGMKSLRTQGLTKEEALLKYLKAYCANYTFADWNLGRVLDELDKSPYAKNTIVVFCSDNGFHNGSKGHWTKSTLWEQADAVPFLIRLPGGKAYKCPQPITLVDIYPTLVEYCGLTPPKQKLDGVSLVPILKNPKYEWDRPGLTTYGEGYSSVRSEQYRYIRYPDGTEELYDHYKDPYEHRNLASKPDMKPVISKLAKNVPVHFEKTVPSKASVKGKKAKDPDEG